jgi:hypothetical protein
MTRIEILEEESVGPRMPVVACRARRYRGNGAGAMKAETRLRELEGRPKSEDQHRALEKACRIGIDTMLSMWRPC